MLMPAMAVPDSKLRKSWLGTVYWKGETLQELAQQIGVDPQGLQASAQRMSEFARTGKDLDFGRGDNVFDRYYGDVNVRPNPNLAPIEKGPFYAMKLHPGDIGTKGGLVTDRDLRTRVLAAGAVGISYSWWDSKHSRHHANPNRVGKDPDIEVDTVSFLAEDAAQAKGGRMQVISEVWERKGALVAELLGEAA